METSHLDFIERSSEVCITGEPKRKRVMATNNENIVCVEVIENLAMQIGAQLAKLVPQSYHETDAIWKAQEYLRNYQANQIKALRDEFED